VTLSRSTLGVLTVLVILGGLTVGVWWRIRPDVEETDGDSDMSEAEAEVAESVVQQFNTEVAVPVTGVVVVRDTLRISATAKARAEALREARISAQVSGIVQSVRVRENQTVAGGQVLIQIDTTEYALDLATSRAALGRAQVEYEVRLLQDERIEDPEVRARRAERARFLTGFSQAEVDLRRAELQMEKTQVVAPFGGRIADLRVVEGQYVAAGEELLTVVTIDPIKVSVGVLETLLVDLEEGRLVSLVFAALPDTTFVGRVETINPKTDLQTQTTRVTVLLDNPGGRIRPGMYANAQVEARQIPNAIIVPRSSIRETEDRRTHVLVLEDGRAKWVYVPLGEMNDEVVQLLGEPGSQFWVEPGSIVLTDGHQSIIHDAAVELVEDVAGAGGRPTR